VASPNKKNKKQNLARLYSSLQSFLSIDALHQHHNGINLFPLIERYSFIQDSLKREYPKQFLLQIKNLDHFNFLCFQWNQLVQKGVPLGPQASQQPPKKHYADIVVIMIRKT
jgi:hypothetical protein